MSDLGYESQLRLLYLYGGPRTVTWSYRRRFVRVADSSAAGKVGGEIQMSAHPMSPTIGPSDEMRFLSNIVDALAGVPGLCAVGGGGHGVRS